MIIIIIIIIYYYYIIIIISSLSLLLFIIISLLLLLLYALICPSMNKFNSNNILNIKLAHNEFIKEISKRNRKIMRNILWIMFNNR